MAAKRKGSGLLAYPQELDRCLEEIFAGLPRGMSVSVKTRIGKNDPAEWPGLLAIYRKYPLSELIVHPRIQKEFYKGVPHRTPGPPCRAPGRRCITETSSRRRTPPPCARIIPERTQ